MRSRLALTLVAAVTTALLSGCDDGDGDAGDESHADPSAPSGQHDKEAAQFFDDAVQRLMNADTGRFHQEFRVGSGGMTMDGSYELSSETSRFLVTTESSGTSVSFELLNSPKDRWVRFVDTGFVQDAKCWLHTGAEDLSQQLGVDFPSGATLGVPAAVLVAANGGGDRWVEEGRVLRGTTDLYTLAGTFGKLVNSLDIDFKSTDQGRVDYLFEDGQLTGWRSSLFWLLDAMKASGAEVPRALQALDEQAFAIEVEASFSDAGSAVSNEPPDPGRVVEMDPSLSEQAFDAAFRACEAR